MQKYIKIIVSVPLEDADRMREVLGKAGAGKIGNYEFGSFSTRGTGRGKALVGSNPAFGTIGEVESTEEEKIETFCKEEDIERIIKIIKENHPYEEPVITTYPVLIY